MVLEKDDPAYISSERFVAAVKKYLLPGYLEKLRKERKEKAEEARIVMEEETRHVNE